MASETIFDHWKSGKGKVRKTWFSQNSLNSWFWALGFLIYTLSCDKSILSHSIFLPLVTYIYTLPIFLKMCVSAPQDTLWDTAGRTAVSSLYVSITTYFSYSPTPSTTTMCQKSECILHPLPSRRASQSEEDALFPICKKGNSKLRSKFAVWITWHTPL